ncbi:subunit 3 of cleavage and polyadenylation specificity factor [Hamiltosporidium magnivora]|uniref:Endoribonuclease YSH1 n=2 Tax=Hamiltosporidium TaxID=1176354 RepID=A0A4Q9L7B5_9MICR|nr:subunit 3 of cleavage and polyadenylation specificity factor [Hamiltosporidium magnivora]
MFLDEDIKITPLGAGNEVGRSCIHIAYKETSILLDCGVHPAYTGLSSLPFIDKIDLSKVSAILITHFHLDHAGGLPFFTEKTNFRGKVYATHPTKVILKYLLNDYIRIINASSDTDFYTERDLKSCIDKIIPIDYHQEIDIHKFKITPLNAGHVLGAAMFILEINKTKILYTGDFSREEDRHLKSAELPSFPLNILITESTYGVQCHLPRCDREQRFTSTIHNTIKRNGKVLLPVFALGRAQELLLILEEYWNNTPSLQYIPIYYASALAKKCLTVYQTYIHMMNDKIKIQALTKNPFIFKHIHNLKGIEHYEDKGPCVMMASPGMLQSGLSRELFEMWCEDSNNHTIIPGYCVQGTLAKEILTEPEEIDSIKGSKLKLRMGVSYISFSAHVDFIQNAEFIEHCSPQHLFLVHGEFTEMSRLKSALAHRAAQRNVEMQIYTPKNCETTAIQITGERTVKIVGEVKEESIIEGIIIASGRGEVRIVKRGAESIENKRINMLENKITEITEITETNQITNEMKDKPTNEISENKSINLKDKISEIKVIQRVIITTNINNSVIKSTLLDFFSNSYVKDKNIWIGDIKVNLEEESIILEWNSNYINDVMGSTVGRVIEDVSKKITCCLGKEEALIKVLRNYFYVEQNDGDILCQGVRICLRNGSFSVENGEERIREKVRGIVERVGFIYE